jgi:hypothetical protein
MKMTGYHRETSAAVPREPSLSDVLNDPIVRAMMRADGVNPDELARILQIPVRGRPFGGPGQPSGIGSPVSKAPQPTTSDPTELPEPLADRRTRPCGSRSNR